jgi:hypothetical protein
MTDRELFQMALNALEEYCQYGVLLCPIERREALRARLAQPEPYPENFIDALRFDAAQSEPVIQARKEGDLIVADLPQVPTGGGGISKDEQPEPVLPGGGIGRHPDIPTKLMGPNLEGILNAAGFVRQKEWVGLTDEEINSSVNTWVRELVFELEVMLRDKNT